MPKFEGFTGLDFQREGSTPGLLQPVSAQHLQPQRERVFACDTQCLAHATGPAPLPPKLQGAQPSSLTALPQTQVQSVHPPVVQASKAQCESLAFWAWRWGLPDCLFKPLKPERLEVRLCLLISACLESSHTNIDPYAAVPAPLIRLLPRHAPGPSAPRQKTRAALEFVADHFAEAVRLALVADRCHMCTSEFSRSFKKENGCTFSEYLLRYRISKACEVLSGLSVQVKTVAFSVGFNDLSYFARIFRRYTGTTPSLYQRAASSAKN